MLNIKVKSCFNKSRPFVVFLLSIKSKPKFNWLLTRSLGLYDQSKQTRMGVNEFWCINKAFRGSESRHTRFIHLCGQPSCAILQTVIQWAIQNGLRRSHYRDSVTDNGWSLMIKHNFFFSFGNTVYTVEKKREICFSKKKKGLNTFVYECPCFLLSTSVLWCNPLGVHSCKGP